MCYESRGLFKQTGISQNAKVVSKCINVLEFVDDVEASSLWAQRKLERKHSWCELRAVCRFMDGLLPAGWLARTQVPSELEGIKRPAAGQYVIEDEVFKVQQPDGSRKAVIPDDWDAESVTVFGQIVDRCAVGSAGLSFVFDTGDMLWTVAWGIAHDGWNAVRNSAKGTCAGGLWKCIVDCRPSAISMPVP